MKNRAAMLFQPEESARFLREVSDFGLRVASKGYVVASLHIDYTFWGSWRLEIWEGDLAVRFWWDDRDRFLCISSSPKVGFSGPNQWRKVSETQICRYENDEHFQFVEEFLAQILPRRSAT